MRALRQQLGRELVYEGRPYSLAEVLLDEAALVLKTHSRLPPIQLDQYGRAAHRADAFITLSVFDDQGMPRDELLVWFPEIVE